MLQCGNSKRAMFANFFNTTQIHIYIYILKLIYLYLKQLEIKKQQLNSKSAANYFKYFILFGKQKLLFNTLSIFFNDDILFVLFLYKYLMN